MRLWLQITSAIIVGLFIGTFLELLIRFCAGYYWFYSGLHWQDVIYWVFH